MQKRRNAIQREKALKPISYGDSGRWRSLGDRQPLFHDNSRGPTKMPKRGLVPVMVAPGIEHPASAPSCAGSAKNLLPRSRFPGKPKRTAERQATHGHERWRAAGPGAGVGVGDGLGVGRKEGRFLEFEVHVDRLLSSGSSVVSWPRSRSGPHERSSVSDANTPPYYVGDDDGCCGGGGSHDG